MLVVGLGNPGREYDGTRHNVGFAVVDELARRWGIGLDRQRHRSVYGKGRIGAHAVVLAQPLTFMNRSGEAVKPLLAYHGLAEDACVVVHDEADLEPGTVRVKSGGGIAGHNGLSSIAAQLGTRDFMRIRLGIGRPPGGGQDLARYVLAPPLKDEAPLVAESIDDGADAVELLLAEGLEAAMRRFNRRV